MDLARSVVENAELSRRDIVADRVELEALPRSLYLDISNRCNIRCPMCPNHAVSRNPKRAAIMAPELFYRMGRELFPTAQTVYLFGGGEVFLHPNWDEFFEFAGRWTFLPIISTNGTLFNEQRIRALVEAGTDLRISFDGADQATFEAIREGARFERVVDGVRRLVRERERTTGTKFSIRFSVTTFAANIRQAARIVELASDLGVDRVVFHHLMVDRNDLAGSELHHFPELSDENFALAVERGADLGVHVQAPPPFDDRGASADRFREATRRIPPDSLAPFFDYPLGPDATYLCRVPWVETWIKPNGDVAPCCLLAFDYSLGNVSKSTFREVWNGKKYQQFRLRVNSLKPPSPCTPEACAHRRHQAERGVLGANPSDRIILDSRCPGHLRADVREIETKVDGCRVNVRFAVSNRGNTLWLADQAGRTGYGVVRLGVQVVSSTGEVLDRDYCRVPLPGDLLPGESTELILAADLPAGVNTLRFDMVAEGVTWFEDQGGSAGSIQVR